MAACACAGGTTTTPTATTSPSTTTTTTTVPILEPWTWGIDTVDLGEGYTLGPCNGDADQIACITVDDAVVGSAEYLQLPVATFDILEGVEDPIRSIEILATDYLATFKADREATCPELGFEPIGPYQATVAGRPGLEYGFRETNAEDVVVEENLLYGLRTDEMIHLFTFAGTAEGSCVGVEGVTPDVLERIAPGIDRAVEVVKLPS